MALVYGGHQLTGNKFRSTYSQFGLKPVIDQKVFVFSESKVNLVLVHLSNFESVASVMFNLDRESQMEVVGTCFWT